MRRGKEQGGLPGAKMWMIWIRRRRRGRGKGEKKDEVMVDVETRGEVVEYLKRV